MIGCKQIGKKVAYSFEENDIWCMDEENYFFNIKRNFYKLWRHFVGKPVIASR